MTTGIANLFPKMHMAGQQHVDSGWQGVPEGRRQGVIAPLKLYRVVLRAGRLVAEDRVMVGGKGEAGALCKAGESASSGRNRLAIRDSFLR